MYLNFITTFAAKLVKRLLNNKLTKMKKLKVFFGIAALAMFSFMISSCSDDDDDTPSLASQAAGSYQGTDTMSFAMLGNVKPYNADGSHDTITVAAKGDNAVTITFGSRLTHTMLGPTFRAYVHGVLNNVVVTENAAVANNDSIYFSNAGTKGDSIQASMSGPVTASTKHYEATVTGAVSKKTHLGHLHIATAFGAMGAVNFESTITSYAAAK